MCLEETVEAIPAREITIIQGDFNAKIGSTARDDAVSACVGGYALGTRNDSGERLLQFCMGNEYVALNTFFQHHVRRLYTWKSPGDRCRNQIDYVLINARWRSTAENSRAYPGADCGSDHHLLITELRIHLRRAASRKPNHKLRDHMMREYTDRVSCSLGRADLRLGGRDGNELWENLKTIMTNTKQEVIADQKTTSTQRGGTQRSRWIKASTWELIEERKRLKKEGSNTDIKQRRLQVLKREIQKYCRKDKNDYYSNVCDQIEAHNNKNENRDLFKKIKELTSSFMLGLGQLRTQTATICMK